jgi:DNA-binding response OmpR family regulator
MHLLVIEDHPRESELLAKGLTDDGHGVELADGESALGLATSVSYDAIVLDVVPTTRDGIAVLSHLRAAGIPTPVVVVAANSDVETRVEALDRGADDFLVKPFAFVELLARLRALARRSFAASTTSIIAVGDLEIDTSLRQVRRAGVRLRLTATEYAVLECLALRKHRVVSRETLIELLYEPGEQPESNVVEVYIATLRRKLGGAKAPQLIHTRRGLGYVLSEEG